MILEDAGTLFSRLCIAGPALYIALTMILHPTSMVEMMHHLTFVLHDFERRLLGQAPQTPAFERATEQSLLWIRISGAVLSVWAFVPLTGLIG